MYTYISLFCKLKMPRSNSTPVAIRNCRAQIVVLNTILPYKEPRLLREMHDSKTGIENIQSEPETFHVVRGEGSNTHTI